MSVRNKAALVTGGLSGIGRALVDELLRNGCRVAICDQDDDDDNELIEMLTQKYGPRSVIYCCCDVTDPYLFERAFQTAADAFGTLDILINNAGILKDRLWELEVDTNLNGTIRGMLLGYRFMGVDNGHAGGVIVNVGSNVSFNAYAAVPIYTATKHAIVGLTRSFGDSFHVTRTGVRVFAVCPGATQTALVDEDVTRNDCLLKPEFKTAWLTDTKTSVTQSPEHVAACVIKLIADAKSGSCWLIEGGKAAKEVPPMVVK